MTVYRFAIDTGQESPGKFSSIRESMRSDVEQRHTKVAIHDEDSLDIKYARLQAEEIINVSGAEIEVYLRTDNNDIDSVFDEDSDPTYWEPVPMKARFKPSPLELELKKWGADLENHREEVVFSHWQLYQQFGERMLRPGDVLRVPYNAAAINPVTYRILNATPSGNFRYIWLYFTCQVEVLTADMTVRPKEDMPIEEEMGTGDAYRESY